MPWQKKKRIQGKNKYYSLSKKQKRENKITDEFEVMFNSLSLEEVIGLKLELASNMVDGKLYGMPIWYSLPVIIKDAILKFSLSTTRTKMEAARLLGLNISQFSSLVKKYNIKFQEKKYPRPDNQFSCIFIIKNVMEN